MKNKHKILVTAPLDFLPDLKNKISSEFDMIYSYGSNKEEIEGLLSCHHFHAWLVAPCPEYMIDYQMVSLCPSLKIIATPSTGSNHIVVEEIKNTGIEIFALKGTKEVEEIVASSEFTFNLLISMVRKMPSAFEAALRGEWRDSESKYRGRELRELTIGIIGYGRIGSNLSKYCQSFGMRILVNDPYVNVNNPYVEVVDKEYLYKESDIITPCVHLSSETYQMIDKSVFNQMKNGAYFLNTSRGDVVNETDLLDALKTKKLKAAALDVITNEYLGDKTTHELLNYARKNDNLIITPHIAGLTYDSEMKAQSAAYAAIKFFLNS